MSDRGPRTGRGRDFQPCARVGELERIEERRKNRDGKDGQRLQTVENVW